MIRVIYALALSQAGCSMLYGMEHLAGTATSEWYPVGPVQKPLAEVLGTTRDIIVKQGYSAPAVEPDARRTESGWDTRLSAHWREGCRTKLEAVVEDAPSGGFMVRVRSHTEINNNSKQPLSAPQAEWIGASLDAKWEGRMSDPAVRFQTMLKLRFFGLGQ